MKLSNDWHDFRAKLNRIHPPVGKPTQLSLEFVDEKETDSGEGLQRMGPMYKWPRWLERFWGIVFLLVALLWVLVGVKWLFGF